MCFWSLSSDIWQYCQGASCRFPRNLGGKHCWVGVWFHPSRQLDSCASVRFVARWIFRAIQHLVTTAATQLNGRRALLFPRFEVRVSAASISVAHIPLTAHKHVGLLTIISMESCKFDLRCYSSSQYPPKFPQLMP
jgi:hypothetical protein